MASFTATTPKCSFFYVSPVYCYSRRSQLARLQPIRAVNSAEPENQNPTTQTQTEQPSATPPSSTAKQASNSGPARPKKPVYSMKKGQIVRVDKEKYLNSINYLSVGHPPYYKGLDYIYEDRGEVLDLRIFETGEYALVSWVGIPTAPAWLPTDMLIKSDKLNYERL
ncbi:hypothetical protein K2173_012082 [Erythroxylum novogranatense]|uniref:NADH dehydrogenase-like complex O n=1 Tax=Erythroxylum novogranatense TaxID=1862640 RepID=A0AAV8TEY9_9ROSI|nr:hypothetical protein K2173_012082 [Erythroxylum novogranatense]